jgi:two-component system, LytTR family, response regulator LytT
MIRSLKIAIIEDEPATARNLQFLLQEEDPSIEVLAMLGSVKEATAWLSEHAAACDLLFMDIRLGDGLSLEIFDQVRIETPVIFVTAFNDYALQAFKANGIDYILKPFDEKDLRLALQRYGRLNDALLRQLTASIGQQNPTYKQSFLVHFRDKLIPLTVEEISWLQSENEITYAQTFQNKKLIVDSTLEQLQTQLDPARFFRVNRQFIVNRKSILEIDFFFNGRLLLRTNPPAEDKMLISKARVPEFKAWMNA